MTDSDPSRIARDTYGFAEKLKSTKPGERKDPRCARRIPCELRASAWTIRVSLFYRKEKTPIRDNKRGILRVTTVEHQERTYVLYRRRMLELLGCPKPAFDQLALELPCLMGFRTKEVTTWRAEYIDFLNAETLVLDAKKHRLFTVPLNNQVARHAEEVLNGRGEGYVLQSRSTAWRMPDRPISTVAVWYIWEKWGRRVGFEPTTPLSPVVGRRFFAGEWFYSQGLSLVTLQRILRHSDPVVTMRYVQSLVFWEDVKRDYDRFQLGLMEKEGKQLA